MDLTSPRRSSRNHASTLALDVAMSVTSSLEETSAAAAMTPVEKKKGPRDSSASSTASKRSTTAAATAAAGKKNGEKKKETAAAATPSAARSHKRKAGVSPAASKRRRRKRSETESSETSEEEDEEEDEPVPLVEQKPKPHDFSVSRLIGDAEPHRDIKRRLDVPDDDALPFPTSVLFCEDALGKVDASQYPPNCTQFNIGGIKYLPLSCLMDDDGFTVSINEPVTYKRTDGRHHTSSLSESLKNSGLTVKRRILGKELLHVLRIAGLVVHWAFVGHLSPTLLKKLQHDRDKARKQHETMLAQYAQLQLAQAASGGGGTGAGNSTTAATTAAAVASDEVVKKTVAELIEERKRRNGQTVAEPAVTTPTGGGLLAGMTFKGTPGYVSPATPAATSLTSPPSSSSTIFPSSSIATAAASAAVRDYRPRSSLGMDALMRAAGMQQSTPLTTTPRANSLTVADLMMQQMGLSSGGSSSRQYGSSSPTTGSSGGVPLRISDPEHLNKFIGLLNGDKDGSPSPQHNGSAIFEQSFSAIDHVPTLSVTEKILLISDYDGGSSEQALAVKYKVPVDKIPGIIRLRVPLIREQARVYMERRRSSRVRALPVRRTNFVGLNIMMWRFFKDCRDRGIALTGRQLKEHAMTIASQLGLSNFKGSEGWLDAFKRRHKIDLRTMTGEAVNYESDPDGNIVCTSADGADDDDYSAYDDTTRSSSSPAAGDTTTDQLLASVTAIVNNELPSMMMMELMGAGGVGKGNGALEDEDDEMDGSSRGAGVGAEGGRGGGLGTSGLQAFQPNYDDPRMAADFRIDESSLITNIIRSTAVYVPNPEVARALDILRSYIVTHDPAAIGFFVDLQTRLASTIAAHQTLENCAAVLVAAQESSSGGLLNGVGGMSDAAALAAASQDDQKTPPMVDGAPKEEESAESSVTSGEKAAEEKENNEEKEDNDEYEMMRVEKKEEEEEGEAEKEKEEQIGDKQIGGEKKNKKKTSKWAARIKGALTKKKNKRED